MICVPLLTLYERSSALAVDLPLSTPPKKTRGLLHSYDPSISSLPTMASLPLVSDVRLTDRRSFLDWYAELKINSTFRNVWHLADPDALNALHLLFAEPLELLTIN